MNANELAHKRCVPCEGGVASLSVGEAKALLQQVPGWSITSDNKRLHRSWRVKDFVTALDFFQRIGAIAESEDHHPDLHLVGYRNVTIEIWTHAVGGLTENDFILGAKINELPIELQTER
jgi:4a-hydroxytetrahydrobiopterin dehydratase